jgi:hypothetical protein
LCLRQRQVVACGGEKRLLPPLAFFLPELHS